MSNTMNSKEIVDEFDIIDVKMGIILYDLYVNRFRKNMEDTEYQVIQEYNEKVILFVEQLREHESKFILDVLIYLDSVQPTLVDITIIQWCLPRASLFRSTQMYDKEYKKNISIFNKKLLDIIDSYVFNNFVVDSTTKTCYIPIHCMDILWHWIPIRSKLDFKFCNSANKNHIGIIADIEDEYLKISFNMESVLYFNVGNMVTNKGPFKYMIKNFIYNKEYKESYEKSITQKNYKYQANNIRKKYDENLIEIQSST